MVCLIHSTLILSLFLYYLLYTPSIKKDDWDFPAVIALHSPPCPIGNSDPKIKVDKKWVYISRDTAMKFGSIQLLCAYLQTQDADPSKCFSEDMRDHLVLHNVLVMQCILEYLVVHLHYYQMGANVIAKDFMADFDVIVERHTKLILEFPFAISRYMTRRSSRETTFTREKKFRERLRCIVTANMSEAEMITKAVEALMFQGDKRRDFSKQESMLKRSACGIGLCNNIHERIKSAMVSENREWVKNNAEENTNTFRASESTFLDTFEDDDWSN